MPGPQLYACHTTYAEPIAQTAGATLLWMIQLSRTGAEECSGQLYILASEYASEYEYESAYYNKMACVILIDMYSVFRRRSNSLPQSVWWMTKIVREPGGTISCATVKDLHMNCSLQQ